MIGEGNPMGKKGSLFDPNNKSGGMSEAIENRVKRDDDEYRKAKELADQKANSTSGRMATQNEILDQIRLMREENPENK